ASSNQPPRRGAGGRTNAESDRVPTMELGASIVGDLNLGGVGLGAVGFGPVDFGKDGCGLGAMSRSGVRWRALRPARTSGVGIIASVVTTRQAHRGAAGASDILAEEYWWAILVSRIAMSHLTSPHSS